MIDINEALNVQEAIWNITIELAPWLFLGTAIAALLHGLLPADFVHRHLHGRGSVAKAVLLGVPLPLCSCGVIPAGLGLKKDGASNGASIGFLISTPQTGVDSILVSASMLGWPFALFKVLSATVTGLVGGIWADRVEANNGILDTAGAQSDDTRDLRGMVDHGVQILRSIWGWLLFGIVASAAITIYLPEEWLMGMAAGGSIIACLAILLFSVPLYVCATASVPIAAALVSKGLPPSAALVFLMAGPASNMATIGAIYRGFGRKILGVYLCTIIVGSIGFGLAFDGIIDAQVSTMMAHSHMNHGEANLFEIISAIALGTLLIFFAVDDLNSWIRRTSSKKTTGILTEISVEGMTCMGCVRKLENKIGDIPGVKSFVVDLKPGRVRIEGDVSDADIRQTIVQAGFRAL